MAIISINICFRALGDKMFEIYSIEKNQDNLHIFIVIKSEKTTCIKINMYIY